MRAFWYGNEKDADPRNRNWGDIITPHLLKALTGQDPVRTLRGGSRVLAVGSILHRARPNDLVWGSGVISPNHVPSCANTLDVRAVRGPSTRRLLERAGAKVPEVYGDPALLAPYIFDVSRVPQTCDLGIIPHYNDARGVAHLASPGVKVIDICAGIDEVLREVASCRGILASSLHGLVLGDCFAERAAWLQVGGGVGLVGGAFKFKDYLLGTGRDPQQPTSMVPGGPLEQIRWLPKPQIDLGALAQACPMRNTTRLDQMARRVIT